MSRIKICAAEEQIRKNVSGAQAEFIRHCRIRNLSLRTIDYYQEDIEYLKAGTDTSNLNQLASCNPKHFLIFRSAFRPVFLQ